jgi:uncharacterized protein YaaQ
LKLVIAVVQGEDVQQAAQKPTEAGIGSTRIATSGGFLQQGNVTLLIGVDDDRVPAALKIIQENCQERTRLMTPVPPLAEPGEFVMAFPVEVQVGGAKVFVVPVDSFEKI